MEHLEHLEQSLSNQRINTEKCSRTAYFMAHVLEHTNKLGDNMNEIKFGDWLKEFKNVDRPIGDLARTMISTDGLEKYNSFANVADIPKEWSYRMYDTAVEVFEYYLVDSVDKYDIEYLKEIVANEKRAIIGKEF